MDIVYPGQKPHENTQGKGTSGYPGGYTADPMESVASYDHIGMVPADLPEYLMPVGFEDDRLGARGGGEEERLRLGRDTRDEGTSSSVARMP